MPWRKLRDFQLRIFGFGYSAKRKTRSEKPRKLILRGFRVFQELRVFDLAERFRGFKQCFGGFYKAERGLKNFGGAWEWTEKARSGWKRTEESRRGDSRRDCKRE